jgi:hypothetical protein
MTVPLEEAAAKERQREHGGTAPGKHSAKVSQSDGRVTNKIGSFAGVSGRQVEKIAAVCEAEAKERMSEGGKGCESFATFKSYGQDRLLGPESFRTFGHPRQNWLFRRRIRTAGWEDSGMTVQAARRDGRCGGGEGGALRENRRVIEG